MVCLTEWLLHVFAGEFNEVTESSEYNEQVRIIRASMMRMQKQEGGGFEVLKARCISVFVANHKSSLNSN